MKKINTVENISKLIKEFIANGGDIYAPRRELPYYDKLNVLLQRYRAQGHPEATMSDAYALCGITFDREYKEFKDCIDVLKEYADENNCVDKIRLEKPRRTYNFIKFRATKDLDCSPSDYLMLMTDFRFSNCYIQDNYIERLKERLHRAYPNGDITGIEHNNPKLYNQLRHFVDYSPVPISMQEAAEILECTNSYLSNETSLGISKKEVLKKYKALKEMGQDPLEDATLLNQMYRLAVHENQTITQWFNSNNLGEYTKASKDIPRFGLIAEDPAEREKELFEVRDKIIKDEYITFSDDPVTNYHQRLNLSKKVIETLKKQRVNNSYTYNNDDPEYL